MALDLEHGLKAHDPAMFLELSPYLGLVSA